MPLRAELSASPFPQKTAWWKACFEDAVRRQQPQHIRARVDGMAELLALEPRSRILDLCCGVGQEAVELARRGHRVLGVDVTEEGLREARQSMRGTNLFCHFVKADMRNIPYSGEFDAVVARHPSFGRFPKERDDLRSLESVRKALKPGGRFLLKLVNRDWVLRHLPLAGSEGGVRFDFASGRLEGQRAAGRDPHAPSSVRLYALTEVLRLLGAAGLAFKRVWGRFDASPYGLDSFHMIVLAERPRDALRARDEDDDLPRAIRVKGRGRSQQR
ncbi:MAG: methyltransferase domain-containing protein [Elusimicrobia bacterium]|nr:methyltransferase domain-containing protein [Elusimicrobiota bacterium]